MERNIRFNGKHRQQDRIRLKSVLKLQVIVAAIAVSSHSTDAAAQDIAVKTNVPVWATATLNAGIEAGLADRWTLEVDAAYNPWTYSDDRKMRFVLIQPEARYWFCEKFEGHFVGVHLHGAQFFGGFRERRYDGYLAGAGVSYGYSWILSPHWSFEATAGAGYVRLWYKDSPRIPCSKCYRQAVRDYVGPTRLGLSFIYLF